MKLIVFLIVAWAALGMGYRHALPSLDGRTVSTALLETSATRLAQAIAPLVSAHPGRSGIYSLPDAHDAYAARVLLARAAERSLDIQSYIWRHDLTGTMLFDALRAAAERGVRVRLLLDDNNTAGLDETLAALDAHPNIEVRLFNPFPIRSLRAIGYLADFFRLNRRMHNKSFTADNLATIIGSRNIGDEYFGAADGVLFVDLDVMAIGPVVSEVSKDFDRYWASGSSYPVARLLPPMDAERMVQIASEAPAIERDPAARVYVEAVRDSAIVRNLTNGTLSFEWAVTHMISDDPAKGLGLAGTETLVSERLNAIIGDAMRNVDLVSAYFVPTAAGTDALAALARRNVKIRVLTNALEATDVPPVHAGYAKRRRPLLEAGVELFELRRLSGSTAKGKAAPMGSSGSSLHSKTFAVDRSRVFIGSFNFDPRSAKLNTELGFIIDSPALAQIVSDRFDTRVPANAYRVRLSGAGELYWTQWRDGTAVRHDTEPGTNWWGRTKVDLISLLPIEWLL